MKANFLASRHVSTEGGAVIAETQRLLLREVAAQDAPFVLRQLNAPGWLRFIGDRGVRTLADALDYIETRVRAQYREHGFGLYLVALKPGGEPIGLCGLVRRDTLPEPDIGFALLEPWHGKGYAQEAAAAVMERLWPVHGLRRVLAITNPDNLRSQLLLLKLGFRCEGLAAHGAEGEPLTLFVCDPVAGAPVG